MTVSSTQNRVTYAGNGSTTVFSFPYFVYSLTDVIATLTDASGNITALANPADFTVAGTAVNGNYPSGVTATLSVAPASGITLSLIRVPAVTQGSDLTDNVAEAAVDKLTIIAQRFTDLFSRTAKLPEGFTATFDPTLPPAMTANKVLAVNSSGNGFTLVTGSASSGTVSSVGLSLPTEFSVGSAVTTSGTLSASWANQTQNKVFAAPSGSTGTPSFRTLVASDIPVSSLAVASMSSGTATSGQLPVANGSGAITWTTVATGGTVTSVALSAPSIFSVTGSPVTTTGTLTMALASQTANFVFAAPNGSSGAPTFRALLGADLPAFGGATSGAAGSKGAVLAPAAGQQGFFLKGDGTWAAVPSGTVTSVDLVTPPEFTVSGDPVTGAGTITISKASQAANLVYAGPSSGPNAAPTFRALVGTDLPIMVGSSNIAAGIAGAVPTPPLGHPDYVLHADGTWGTGGAGTGSVTSVALSLPAELTVTGSPVTSSGTLSATWASQVKNKVFAGPTGGANATPAFRSLVASDIPPLILTPTTTISDYSVLSTDRFLLVNSALNRVITLPDATSNDGMVVMIKNIGSGSPNIVTTSSQTIDGQTNLTINVQYASVSLIAISGAWYLW